MSAATGWTLSYMLWGITWINLRMMIADAPRYVSDDVADEVYDEPDTIEEIEMIMKKMQI